MLSFFFFNDTATTEIYTLSLHDALPISFQKSGDPVLSVDTKKKELVGPFKNGGRTWRSEEHTSELQSRLHLVCRLLLEKKKRKQGHAHSYHITLDKTTISLISNNCVVSS